MKLTFLAPVLASAVSTALAAVTSVAAPGPAVALAQAAALAPALHIRPYGEVSCSVLCNCRRTAFLTVGMSLI
jgi:hypothetical protein